MFSGFSKRTLIPTSPGFLGYVEPEQRPGQMKDPAMEDYLFRNQFHWILGEESTAFGSLGPRVQRQDTERRSHRDHLS
jgi:hypothetical protein